MAITYHAKKTNIWELLFMFYPPIQKIENFICHCSLFVKQQFNSK